MRLFLVAALAALFTVATASPVAQDGGVTTVVPPEADEAAGVTVETLIVNDETEAKKFKYPLEPEIAVQDEGDDILHDETELDPRIMEEAGITHVVHEREDSMPYYAGRAKCQCGRPGERDYPLRIVNGTVIRINDYPWTVALVRKRWIGKPRGAYCGGTLINSRYVVTAAHCVDGMSPTGIEAWIHEEDFSSNTETEGGTQKFQVERITIHPYYSRRTIDNDIALIKLAEPVILDNVIVPACLPAGNDYSFEGVLATAAGWGATEEGGSTSKQLLKVDVPIISNEDCNTKTSYSGKITENMLCAGYVEEGGKDSCQGDSGGPLIIENGGRRTLVGTTSWGHGCARPRAPGVYTRVGRYPEWIVKNSNGADWCEI